MKRSSGERVQGLSGKGRGSEEGESDACARQNESQVEGGERGATVREGGGRGVRGGGESVGEGRRVTR